MIGRIGMLAAVLLSAVTFSVHGQTTAAPEPTSTFRGVLYDVNDSFATPAPIVVNRRTGTGLIFTAIWPDDCSDGPGVH